MKKMNLWVLLLVLCLLAAGCGKAGTESAASTSNTTQPDPAQAEALSTEAADKGGEDVQNEAQQPSRTDIGSTDDVSGYPVFDLERRTATLNSGYEMPILGLGMFSLSDSQAENSTYWALKAGFRLIDTARIYGNEAAVERGLQRAIDEGIVRREISVFPAQATNSISWRITMSGTLNSQTTKWRRWQRWKKASALRTIDG